MKSDHVVLDAKTQEYVCDHCGELMPLPKLPMRIDLFVGIGKAFVAAHRRCKRREAKRG